MLPERFMSKVEVTESCWFWKGGKTPRGYGVYSYKSKSIGAHQYAFQITKGDMKDGHIVMHTCDNPACVNPEHLIMGTHKDNSKDKFNKGRANIASGDRHRSKTSPELTPHGEMVTQSKLTWEQVDEIRRTAIKGNRWHNEFSYRELSKRYGVAEITIHNIVNNKKWIKKACDTSETL